MTKICMLTGVENETPIKKMCVNCVYAQYNEETENYVCNNEEIMKIGIEKVKESAKNAGFDIDTLTLKPMNLKNPLKKCEKYIPNVSDIEEYIKNIFK